MVGAVDHGRRAHLLRAREEPRRLRPLPHPRRGDGRVRHRLPGADRARVGALRGGSGRVRGGEGDQRVRDVARRRARVLPRPPRARRAARARRGGADGGGAVDGLHGDADDGERVLPAVPRVRRWRSCCGSSGRRRCERRSSSRVCLVAYLTRQQAVALLPALLTAPLLRRRAGAPSARYALALRRWLPRASSGSSSSSWRAAARRSASSARTRWRAEPTTPLAEVAKWFALPRRRARASRSASSRSRRCSSWRSCRAARRSATGSSSPRPLSLSFWLVLGRGRFASEQTFRIAERNMFYVAPLFLIALLVLDRARPAETAARDGDCGARRRRAAARDPVRRLHRAERGLRHLGAAAARVARRAGAGALGREPRRPRRRRVVAGLAFLFVPAALRARAARARARLLRRVAAPDRRRSIASARHSTSSAGITTADRDWIDRAVGRDEAGVAVWTGTLRRVHRLGERVLQPQRRRRSTRLARRSRAGSPRRRSTVDRRTGYFRDPDGRRVRAAYVLTDALGRSSDGERRRRGRTNGHAPLSRRRPAAPARVRRRPVPAGHVVGPGVTYTRHDCRGGTLDGRAAERSRAVLASRTP